MPVSSLFLRSWPMAKLAVLSFMSTSVFAQSGYQLQAQFSGPTFLDNFNFVTGDPNGDFVDYVDYATALNDGLVASDRTGTYLAPDSTTVLNPNGVGRESVKIVSTQTWTHGLVISDINNMPGGVCGVEARHYLAGATVADGEIDIISGINNAAYNSMALFTQSTCSVAGDGQIGTSQSTDCSSATGCSVLHGSDTTSFGNGFNNNGGGVFATQWESGYIRIWFFDFGTTPSDITAGTPDPTLWGEPVANFQGSCNIDGSFSDNSIVFDMDFCSALVEANWAADGCNSLAATCREYIASFPDDLQHYNDFQKVYWGVNSVKVYQRPQASPSSSSASASTSFSSSAAVSTSLPASATPSAVASSSTTPILTSAPASIVSSTASPTPSSVLSSYVYYGCVEEGLTTRILYDFHEVDPAMTLEICAAACVGYTYFGTEYADECYCGNTFLAPVITAPDIDCWMPCAADLTEMCGGPDRLSVYSINAPIAVSSSIASSSSVISAAVSSTLVSSAAVQSSSPAAVSSSAMSISVVSSVGPASSSVTTPASSSIADISTAQSSAVQSTSASTSEPQTSTPVSSSVLSSTSTTSLVPSVSAMTSSTASFANISSSTSSASSSFFVSSSSLQSSIPLSTTASSTGYSNSSSTYAFSTMTKSASSIPVISTAPVYTNSSSTNSFSAMTKSTSSVPVIYTAPEYTVSTVFATTTYTITSCAATVTDCPQRIGQLTTETISLYTTYCPVKDVPTTTAIQVASETPVSSVSTVYATTTYTITSCAATVTDCRLRIGQVTTETLSSYVTSFPVTKAPTPTAALNQYAPSQEVYTTIVVTTYVDICSTGLTTITTSSTMTLPVNTAGPVAPALIPFTTKAATLTFAGTTVTMHLTVPLSRSSGLPRPNTILSTIVVVPIPVATKPSPAGLPANSGAIVPSAPAPTTGTHYSAGNSSSVGALGTAIATGHVQPTATVAPYSGAGKFQMSFGACVFALVGMFALL